MLSRKQMTQPNFGVCTVGAKLVTTMGVQSSLETHREKVRSDKGMKPQ